MKKQLLSISIIVVIAIGFALYGTSFSAKKTATKTLTAKAASLPIDGASLTETKCMICHKIQSSPEAMLAPPFAHIKKKYSKVYKTEAAFHSAVVNFTINPTEQKALMQGALKRFKIMPKMGYEKPDLEAIAHYIYATDFPQPKW